MNIDHAEFYFSAKNRLAKDARPRAQKAKDKKAKDGIDPFLGSKIGTSKDTGDCDYGSPQGARKAASVFKGDANNYGTPQGARAAAAKFNTDQRSTTLPTGANVVKAPNPRAKDRGSLKNRFT